MMESNEERIRRLHAEEIAAQRESALWHRHQETARALAPGALSRWETWRRYEAHLGAAAVAEALGPELLARYEALTPALEQLREEMIREPEAPELPRVLTVPAAALEAALALLSEMERRLLVHVGMAGEG